MSEGIKSAAGRAAGAPWWVTIFTPVTRSLLGTRIPMGFNGLITIRGRKSGLPRTTPIAIIQVSGRRWVWSPWGEVNWVRNLRAAGEAQITFRAGRTRSGRPSWTRRNESPSSATRSARSREPSRSVARSSGTSMGPISTSRRKRPRVGQSSNSTCCASGQPRRRASQSRARIVFASRSSPRSAAATASRHGIFSSSRCSSSSGPSRSPSAGRRSVAR